MSDNRRLPVWRTLAECFRLLAVHRWVVLKRGWLPFVLWVAGLYLLGFAMPQQWDDSFTTWLTWAVQAIGGAAVLTLLFVPWFCAVAGPAVAAGGGRLRAYLHHGGWLLLITLVVYASAWGQEAFLEFAGVNVTSGPWNVIAAPSKTLLPLYLLARLGLILPITAIEGRGSIAQAWSRSRGNGWRVMAVFFVPLITFALLGALLGDELWSLFPEGQEAVLELSRTIYSSFFVFLDSLILATTLAILYRSARNPA